MPCNRFLEGQMTKEEEILAFLDDKVFQPILTSANAPKDLKAGARITRQ